MKIWSSGCELSIDWMIRFLAGWHDRCSFVGSTKKANSSSFPKKNNPENQFGMIYRKPNDGISADYGSRRSCWKTLAPVEAIRRRLPLFDAAARCMNRLKSSSKRAAGAARRSADGGRGVGWGGGSCREGGKKQVTYLLQVRSTCCCCWEEEKNGKNEDDEWEIAAGGEEESF